MTVEKLDACPTCLLTGGARSKLHCARDRRWLPRCSWRFQAVKRADIVPTRGAIQSDGNPGCAVVIAAGGRYHWQCLWRWANLCGARPNAPLHLGLHSGLARTHYYGPISREPVAVSSPNDMSTSCLPGCATVLQKHKPIWQLPSRIAGPRRRRRLRRLSQSPCLQK